MTCSTSCLYVMQHIVSICHAAHRVYMACSTSCLYVMQHIVSTCHAAHRVYMTCSTSCSTLCPHAAHRVIVSICHVAHRVYMTCSTSCQCASTPYNPRDAGLMGGAQQSQAGLLSESAHCFVSHLVHDARARVRVA